MKEHGFRWVLNVAYSPQWNPIELVFSQVKANFRKLRARKFMGFFIQSHEDMVMSAIQKVKKIHV